MDLRPRFVVAQSRTKSALQELIQALDRAPEPSWWDYTKAFLKCWEPRGEGKPDLKYWTRLIACPSVDDWPGFGDSQPPLLRPADLENPAVEAAFTKFNQEYFVLDEVMQYICRDQTRLSELLHLPDEAYCLQNN
jgi:hypothetical protein